VLKSGEGAYVADQATLAQLEAGGQVLARYASGNPNGSAAGIAGIAITAALAAQALAMAADLAGATVLAAVQAHGAYGMTEDSDIQLYFRRAHIDRIWMGAPRNLRQEVLPLLGEAHRAGHRRP